MALEPPLSHVPATVCIFSELICLLDRRESLAVVPRGDRKDVVLCAKREPLNRLRAARQRDELAIPYEKNRRRCSFTFANIGS
jgi:hypothetical protein